MRFIHMNITAPGSMDGLKVESFVKERTYQVTDDLAKAFVDDTDIARDATDDEIAACMAEGRSQSEDAATAPDENAATAPDETKAKKSGRKTRGEKKAAGKNK